MKNPINVAVLLFLNLISLNGLAQTQVGIGTTTPQSTLDVSGGFMVGDGFAGNSSLNPPSDSAIIEGDVGIGTDTPQSKLYIKGTTGQVNPLRIESSALRGGMIIRNTSINSGSTNDIRFLSFDGSGTSIGGQIISLNSGELRFVSSRATGSISWYSGKITTESTRRMQLNSNGELYVDSQIYSNTSFRTSDFSLNRNFLPLDDATNTINALTPVKYKKKKALHSKEYTEEEFGFIVEELKKILPEITSTNGSKELEGIDMEALIPILVKAFQEKKQRNDKLEQRLATLEKKVENISE